MQAAVRAQELWPTIEELNASRWPEQMDAVVSAAQRQALRLASGYLTAFMRSELGGGRTISLDTSQVGLARDGRPLVELLSSPLIGVKAALKKNRSAPDALQLGWVRAKRSVEFEVMQTPRDVVREFLNADDRFDGFQRAVAGTCAACEALSGDGGPHFEVHPGCECELQPVVAGTRDLHPVATGFALFMRKSSEAQDAAVGPEAAELIRSGQADLRDFVSHSKQDEQPDFITQRPVKDVHRTATESPAPTP